MWVADNNEKYRKENLHLVGGSVWYINRIDFISDNEAKSKIKSDIDFEIETIELDLKNLKEYKETLKKLKAGDLEISPCFYD